MANLIQNFTTPFYSISSAAVELMHAGLYTRYTSIEQPILQYRALLYDRKNLYKIALCLKYLRLNITALSHKDFYTVTN